eukprot:COSAG04_NODE_2175_length_4628_cov_4.893133_6_plen_166_part_01
MPFGKKKKEKKKKEQEEKEQQQQDEEGVPPAPEDDDELSPLPDDELDEDEEEIFYERPEGEEVSILVTEDENGSVGLEVEDDCTVSGFTSDDSPAALAGIVENSVIIAVNGQDVRNKNELIEVLLSRPEDEEDVEFTLVLPPGAEPPAPPQDEAPAPAPAPAPAAA